MLLSSSPSAGRMALMALMAVIGLLVSLPSVIATVDAPNPPVRPEKTTLDPQDNPYGVKLVYTVAWLNKEQKAFGASLIVTCSNPTPDPSWTVRFQFASANTKVTKFWGTWNLTRYETSWYMAVPTPSTAGQPAVEPGDDKAHSYSFNGIYTGDDVNAAFPNGYSLAKDPTSNVVILTPAEARNTPLSPDIPTVATGEFNRQQRSAAGESAAPPNGGSLPSTASNNNSNSTSDKSTGGAPLVGLCAFAGVMAIGLTVVGVATYRRRQHRRDFRAHQAAKAMPAANKSLESAPAQEDAVAMPEPGAINNHSTAARAAAGAVIMQQMDAPEQAIAQDYYMEDEQQVQAEVDQAYYDQYDGQPEGEFDAQPRDDQVYMEGLPEYAVQYDGGEGELEAEAIYNNAAANVNSAVEHVDLRPPVAQEYYVADTVAYDDAQLDRSMGPMDDQTQLEYIDDQGVGYDENNYVDENNYADEQQQGYDENAVYAEEELLDESQLPPINSEEGGYVQYDAAEFEASEMDDTGNYPPQQQ